MALLTSLMLTESGLTMVAGVVSMRVMRPEIPFTFQVLAADDEVRRLDAARGIIAGCVWGTVLWTGVITLIVLATAE